MIMTKPNCFIIGAPKCGTTSLKMWLQTHPKIYFPPIAEPHFFNDDGERRVLSLRRYEELFSYVEPKIDILIDCSPHYLFSARAIENIINYQPNAKFIVCLRNPVEMAASLHAEQVWQGTEPVKDFLVAWSLQSDRKRGRNIPNNARADPSKLLYGEYCKLGSQLQRLLNRIDINKVHWTVLDDIKRDPKREYQKILNFLGLEGDGRIEFISANQRKVPRSVLLAQMGRRLWQIKNKLGLNNLSTGLNSRLKSINQRRPVALDFPEKDKLYLRDYFREDVELLSNLLDRDLVELWIDTE